MINRITKMRVFSIAWVNGIYPMALKVYEEKMKKYHDQMIEIKDFIQVIWYFYTTQTCFCFPLSSNQRGRDHSQLYNCCHTEGWTWEWERNHIEKLRITLLGRQPRCNLARMNYSILYLIEISFLCLIFC